MIHEAGDGRNIDAGLGTLSGEGSHQLVKGDDVPHRPPLDSTVRAGEPTYYNRPVIKQSVWSWSIPAYYYCGGAAGTATALGAAATLLNRDELAGLVLQSRVIGAAGSAVSAVLLIYDLGRRGRFLNMLRVFRPSSPMSVGSWLLVTFSGTVTLAALAEFAPRGARPWGDAMAVLAGVLGLGLSGYTGVLVAHTVVPVWQKPHRLLPVLFLASGVTGAAALFEMVGGNPMEVRAARVFGIAGKSAEIVAASMVSRSVGEVAEAARPLEEGLSGFLWKAAKVFTIASLALSLAPSRNRRLRQAAGVLGTLGSLCTRFGVHYAGQTSALNPRATFRQQRAGQGAFEVTGRAAVTGPNDIRAFGE